jgi:hypothetical protein
MVALLNDVTNARKPSLRPSPEPPPVRTLPTPSPREPIPFPVPIRRELPPAAPVLLDEVYRARYRALCAYAYARLSLHNAPGDWNVDADDVVSDALVFLLDYATSEKHAHRELPATPEHMHKRLKVCIEYAVYKRLELAAKAARQRDGRSVVRLGAPIIEGASLVREAAAPPLVLPAPAGERERVRLALRNVAPSMRAVLAWHQASGLDLVACAALTGRTPSSLNVSLGRARKQFAEVYRRLAAVQLTPGGRVPARRDSARPYDLGERSRTLAILARCATQPT